MSFILDALRKSEHERQRQLGPSIAELPVARPAARVPAWVWVALAALLTINVAVVAWFVTRDGSPSDSPRSAATEPASAAPPPALPPPPPPATAAAAGAGPAAPAPVAASPVATTPLAAVADSSAPASRDVRPLAEEAVADPPAPAFEAPEAPDPALLPVPPPPAPRAAPVAAGVPSIEQLPPQATAGLPPLNIDLHIYASQPSQRAVFINGTRYREGDSLPGGAELQQITPEGAVLSYRGQRFLLPRQ